jgi:hypothetical protein
MTDVEERLPISLRERHDSSNASSSMPSAALIDSSTLGPPGWDTHEPMSSILRSVSARKAVTSSAN